MSRRGEEQGIELSLPQTSVLVAVLYIATEHILAQCETQEAEDEEETQSGHDSVRPGLYRIWTRLLQSVYIGLYQRGIDNKERSRRFDGKN